MNTVIPTRNRTIPLSSQELLVALQAMAHERLTQKQKRILIVIGSLTEDFPVTKVVRDLAGTLDCSESAVWNNLLQLKSMGLIDSGDAQTKGKPVHLTTLGALISQRFGGTL